MSENLTASKLYSPILILEYLVPISSIFLGSDAEMNAGMKLNSSCPVSFAASFTQSFIKVDRELSPIF
jgi:hypothetical protein